MSRPLRGYAPGVVFGVLGAILILAGTGASLGYLLLADERAPAGTPASSRSDSTGGMALAVDVDLEVPVLPDVPLSYKVDPKLAEKAPLPGASAAREVALEKAGLGAGIDVGLAAGSHRTIEAASTPEVRTSAARETLAPLAAPAAVAAAALTLGGIVAFFWQTIKAWSLRFGFFPLLALYAKISRAEVFDNDVRERIFGAIRATPGASASELARAADVSWGTTIYHLDVLEQTRMVTSIRKGRYRRYFENGAQLAASKDVVAMLRNPVTASVVDTLRRAPGVTQKELAAATQMTPQALHWHLSRLVESGLVRKSRDGRVVRHFIAG